MQQHLAAAELYRLMKYTQSGQLGTEVFMRSTYIDKSIYILIPYKARQIKTFKKKNRRGGCAACPSPPRVKDPEALQGLELCFRSQSSVHGPASPGATWLKPPISRRLRASSATEAEAKPKNQRHFTSALSAPCNTNIGWRISEWSSFYKVWDSSQVQQNVK